MKIDRICKPGMKNCRQPELMKIIAELEAQISKLKIEKEDNLQLAQDWEDQFNRVEAQIERMKGIGFGTHPSWGCSKEFSDGWKSCREQIGELLDLPTD